MRVQAMFSAEAVVAIASLAASGALAQGPGMVQKPFETIYRRPNVSPYANLETFANNPIASASIYQQLVQPQQEQQRQQIEQLQQRRQMGQMQNQMRQMQQSSQARQLDETIRPTGHASTYMNYSHFYPPQRR